MKTNGSMNGEMKRLVNQVAIITGASSGIGAGVSKALAREGAMVVINYPVPSGKEMADAVVQEIVESGGKAITYQCDVSKEDEVKKMFADIADQFGTVHILVNNAGLQKDSRFEDMSLDQ